MEDPKIDFDLSDPSDSQRIPWVWITVIVIVGATALAAYFIMQGKHHRDSRQAIVQILEKELDAAQEDMTAQKEKVVEITQRLDAIKTAIQLGTIEDSKKAVTDYNKLVVEQRAERDKFAQMADQYNQKVSKLRQLE
jgi:hypothetical protein